MCTCPGCTGVAGGASGGGSGDLSGAGNGEVQLWDNWETAGSFSHLSGSS